ncbi:MAG: LytTR family DNA-binding domain-containing protein [Bacteroidota bacterium]
MRAIELNFRRSKYLRLLIAVSIALILITGKDLLHAVVKNHAFYLSESLLFGSYWLLYIPIFFYGKSLLSKANGRLQLILPVLIGLMHVLIFAGLVTIVSNLFYAYPFRFIPVFVKTISGYGFSSMAIYAAALYVLKYQSSVKEKPRLADKTILKVKQQNSTLHIKTADIMFLKSKTPYVGIHTATGTFLKQSSLKSMMTQLPDGQFIRIHKSYVVNKGFIQSVNSRKNGDFDMVLPNNQTIRASRTYRKNFESLLH